MRMLQRLVGLSLLVLGSSAAVAASALPLNVVVFVLDDVSAEDIGAYGNAGIRTPVMDRLAAEGWRFDNAFLSVSICSPSRISLLTGRYPHSTGARNLHEPLPAGQTLLSAHLRDAGYFTASAGKWHMGDYARRQFDRVMESSRPEQHQDWLRLVHERPRNKPFFLWLATYDAHRPFDAPITLHGHSPEAVLVPAGLIDNDATRNDLAEYYAMIHRADMDIGLVLRLLERQGVLQNTLVIVVGDNGRSFPWAKSYLYDAGLKTPLIVHWPEGLKANASAALVSSVDIAPTVLELLGLSPSNAMQGESFAGLLAGRQSAHRDAVFAERNWRGIYPADARSVRTADYLYIRNYDVIADNCLGSDSGNPSSQSLVHANAVWMDAPLTHRCFPALWPEEELYALSTDPDQQINRATDPALNGVLESMRQRLTDWQRDTGDYRSVRYSPLTEQWCQQHNQVGCH